MTSYRRSTHSFIYSQSQTRKVLEGVAILVLLGGCAITRPPGLAGCQDYIEPLNPSFVISRDQLQTTVMLDQESKLVESLQDTFSVLSKRKQTTLNILSLSGGSQWGAFGAGFLSGWSEADDPITKREDIDIVTGISTGALIASPALLGSNWDELLTDSYLGTGKTKANGIREHPIDDKAMFKKFGLIRTLLSNAALDPRGRLDTLVKNGVAKMFGPLGVKNGKQVYAGAVDLEDGSFKVFHLKTLAEQAAQSTPVVKANLLACYSEMLLAAAAGPIAFPPRFMDGRMYVDGGVRFDTFVLTVDLAIDLYAAKSELKLKEKNIFVIVNGDLQIKKKECDENKDCVGNHLLDIAKRSAKVLLDQNKENSIYRIEMDAVHRKGKAPWKTHYVYVRNPKVCKEAQRKSGDKINKVFQPAFMACLYKQGWDLGKHQKWLTFEQIPH